MAASPKSKLTIFSHKGPYEVEFISDPFTPLATLAAEGAHFIVDRKVAGLYAKDLAPVLSSRSVLLMDATEEAKSIEAVPAAVRHLVEKGLRRGQTLVAVGGGIVQDMTCFLAATMLRGVDWVFAPTTLLAQADSCVGSKSSINGGGAKNALGTFLPPRRILLSTRFLDTLEERDIRSGIGEMLKVHAISGPKDFDAIAADYPRLLTDRALLERYLVRSLEIKKPIVEADEFDKSTRLVMNYGHSFGHALEAATDYAVPHGIAVTIGMDLANYASGALDLGDAAHYRRMRPVLAANWRGFESVPVPVDSFLAALSKDKKNTATALGLILPDAAGRIRKVEVPNDARLREAVSRHLASGRREVLA